MKKLYHLDVHGQGPYTLKRAINDKAVPIGCRIKVQDNFYRIDKEPSLFIRNIHIGLLEVNAANTKVRKRPHVPIRRRIENVIKGYDLWEYTKSG